MVSDRVLVCAFACCPPGMPGFSGGEDVLGWSMLKQIARFHEVWALTQAEDREDIEQAMGEEPIPNLHFCYVGLPHWLRPALRFQGAHQIYYHLWQMKAYFAARRLHNRVQFDLFHHVTYANDWLASFIGAFLPIPYVRGPGGGSHRTPKGLEAEYTLGGRIWEKVRSVGQRLLRLDPFFIKGQARASAILVCNQEAMSTLSKAWPHKAHLFPVSGVSSEDLALTTPIQIQNREFRVMTAGTLIRVKGFGLAVKAFKEFVDRYPDSEFTIVGSGPEEQRLRALIQQLKLDDSVHIICAMPRDRLLADIRRHDVFLFPSLRDGGGTVVIEAMAAGKPVICLDNGGPGMHVTEEWGIKITPTTPQDTVNQIANALERLYLDEELRLELGKAGRERAIEAYHWDRLGDRLMEVYKGVLPGSKP